MDGELYYVYILTNRSHTTLYIGVTNNLVRRLYEHRSLQHPGFSSRYRTTKLVAYESCTDIYDALTREKQLKGWTRKKKNGLIEQQNPEWKDLGEQFFDGPRD